MLNRWIAEATECDFKVALEIKKPKRRTRRLNLLTDEGTILFGALFSFGMIIGIALYYAVISPFLKVVP
jgi:hypothetical protein